MYTYIFTRINLIWCIQWYSCCACIKLSMSFGTSHVRFHPVASPRMTRKDTLRLKARFISIMNQWVSRRNTNLPRWHKLRWFRPKRRRDLQRTCTHRSLRLWTPNSCWSQHTSIKIWVKSIIHDGHATAHLHPKSNQHNGVTKKAFYNNCFHEYIYAPFHFLKES